MNPVEHTIWRFNHLIDPNLSIWKWQIPSYLFLGGLVAGLMIIVSFEELFKRKNWNKNISITSSILSLILLSLGMFFLFLDLEYKFHVYRFYFVLKPLSPMSWGSWILIITYPTLLLWLIGSLKENQLYKLNKSNFLNKIITNIYNFSIEKRKTILKTNIIVGIALGTYTGVLLQTLTGRPLWNSSILGPLFLASGVSAGAATLLIFNRNNKDFTISFIKWDIWALSIELVILFLFVIGKLTGPEVFRNSVKLLLIGPYAGYFFTFVIFGGIIIPLIVEGTELKHKSSVKILTPILVLIGGFALRYILLKAGLMASYASIF